jgi:hypothetical protein
MTITAWRPVLLLASLALGLGSASAAFAEAPGLLFRVSADQSTTAEVAGGQAVPNFQDKVAIVPTGRAAGAIEWQDDGVLAWAAPGNIYAEKGTLSFFWRSRYPVGEAPFVLFRVGYADHSSWDMAWLRIDWNGEGFDAFVTDANLARTRVSFKLPKAPAADAWTHMAFAWDEARGVRLYVDGREVARKDVTNADYDAALDQFGLAGRVIAPHQVQSRYNFLRGSDFDELRVYDRMLDPAEVAALARNEEPASAPAAAAADFAGWMHRYGWDRGAPPVLAAPATRIRKVEFADAKDLKEWMWKGIDGIPETTWPGVYNQSRLPGRTDYFVLPDWNTYVEGGRAYDLALPDEPVNRIEIRGAAFGTLTYKAGEGATKELARRPEGVVRTVDSFDTVTGGKLTFTNAQPETPIQEIWAYNVTAGPVPSGAATLTYTVRADAAPTYANLDALNAYIAGRHPAGERATVVALPSGAPTTKRTDGPEPGRKPIVHVLIPSNFGEPQAGLPLSRAWGYGWENMHHGLDGVAIDLPALKVAAGQGGVIPLNIRIKDPIWPARDMIDVSVSVRPGEARTLWLDLRDRILTGDSLYLTIAAGSADFGPEALEGTRIRLVFKPREQATPEHVADRFNQVKDNWGFLVEEHTASKRQGLYLRAFNDISDLLRVDPDHFQGRMYWNDMSYGAQGTPPFEQPRAPDGTPLWAFRQLEDLKLTRQYMTWWIDNRQVDFGDFGGGISDDSDLMQQWPGMALMGVDPDKIRASLNALADAAHRHGMFTNGLGTITTDELHVYEEGINADSAALYLNWGDPKRVERVMATVKALDRIILPSPRGDGRLFSSNWFGGKQVYREAPWNWQKPYSFVIVHPSLILPLYNGDPTAKAQIVGLADGYLAHGKQAADGVWTYPNEINFDTGAERGGDLYDASGGATPHQTFWGAYRLTGDRKYLAPILGRMQRKGEASSWDLNENLIDDLGLRGNAALAARASADSNMFSRYAAWQLTGDKTFLERLHADSIQTKAQSMYMNTEGHWWSDRVESETSILQRERLGGVALKRNWTWPGHTVSWRFDDPEGAVKTAILLPGATRTKFTVIAYNTGDTAQTATMTTWNVAAGRWRMQTAAGEAAPAADAPSTMVTLGRSAGVEVSFAPRAYTRMDFVLVEAETPTEARPDLGIGADDVVSRGGSLSVTVHSLGGADVPAGASVWVEDRAGRVIARARLPALKAPRDLAPKTATVRLRAGKASGMTVRVALAGDAAETTRLNNAVAVP